MVPFWDPVERGYEGPLYALSEWDTVILGGGVGQLPGICDVEANPSRKLDEKRAAGSDGGTPTFHGYKNAEVTLTVTVWTPGQWRRFQECMAILWPLVRKKVPRAIDIYHPKLALYNIRSVMVVAPSTPRAGASAQTKVFTIKCQEFQPIKGKKATVTLNSSADVRPEFRDDPILRNEPPAPIFGVDYTSVNDYVSLPSTDVGP